MKNMSYESSKHKKISKTCKELVVKKIIKSYGGRVWLESKVGKESTFFFTLLKQEMGVQNEKLKANPTCGK